MICPIKTSLKNKTKAMIYCRKCLYIPLIQLLVDIEIKVKVICPCGTKIKLLNDYIKEIQSELPTNYCEKLLSHSNNKSSSYCITCQLYLCRECYIKHKVKYKSHSFFPTKIYVQIKKYNDKHKHWNYLFFCLECFSQVCLLCDRTHIEHYR